MLDSPCNNIAVNNKRKELHKTKKSKYIWKNIFTLFLTVLFIVNNIIFLSLFLNYSSGVDFMISAFLLFTIVDLLHLSLLSKFNFFKISFFDTSNKNFTLLTFSFIILIIANLIFGYDIYYQARGGIGAGFITIYPFLLLVGFNDFTAIMFLQHYRTN